MFNLSMLLVVLSFSLSFKRSQLREAVIDWIWTGLVIAYVIIGALAKIKTSTSWSTFLLFHTFGLSCLCRTKYRVLLGFAQCFGLAKLIYITSGAWQSSRHLEPIFSVPLGSIKKHVFSHTTWENPETAWFSSLTTLLQVLKSLSGIVWRKFTMTANEFLS